MIVNNPESLINCTYPGIDSTLPPAPDYFLRRMILAPRNIDVRDLNERILNKMAGESKQYISADQIM
ncbi:hypothetical protein BDN70DRAFT_818127, partial [Pholiota conissans]